MAFTRDPNFMVQMDFIDLLVMNILLRAPSISRSEEIEPLAPLVQRFESIREMDFNRLNLKLGAARGTTHSSNSGMFFRRNF